LGIIGTGLLAIPVLAGSAAYALGEAMRWPIGLARKPHEAKAFYATIAIATLLGTAIVFSHIDPIRALVWSAVINGVVSVPVMIMMMLMTARVDIMKGHTVAGALRWTGWLATGVMAAAVVAMFAAIFT
jgi:Mn2+/Fe2+ NRAMP family transporter